MLRSYCSALARVALLAVVSALSLILLPARAWAAPAPPQPIVPALAVGPCSLIQSDFGGEHGNFEALILEGSNLVHYFKLNSSVDTPWSRGPIVSTLATGAGCLIQSDYMSGEHGNFEAVVLEGSALVHYFKVNTSVAAPWQRGAVISSQATGPGCLIQSDFKSGAHGNFEVVVQEGSNLVHYFKVNTSLDAPWQRGAVVSSQATGPGCLIQSDFKGGDHGNFEVVVQEGSKLVHYFKVNTSLDAPWQRGAEITPRATGPGTLIQSRLQSAGHGRLEVLVPEANRLVHYYFADLGAGRRWHTAQTVTAAATGPAALIQSDYFTDDYRNFEVLAPVADANSCWTAAPCIRHFFRFNDVVDDPWRGGPVAAYTGRSQKVCQVTGNTDREWGLPTVNQTEQAGIGVWGTDLGIVTEHRGRIYILFGDTIGTQLGGGDTPDPKDGDTYAATYDRTAEDCLQLQFFSNPATNRWRPLTIPGVAMGTFETPTGAFSHKNKLYVFVMTGWNAQARTHDASVLARSQDDGVTFERVDAISSGRFINIAPMHAATPGTPTLPAEAGLWLWGSGRYRNSPVYLAWLPLRAIDDNPRSALRFFSGMLNGRPTWSTNEAEAEALTDRPCTGELSADWNGYLRRYLLYYNCDAPRGIHARAATQPWGPWSAPAILFNPNVDGGYCHFIHHGAANCDRVADRDRADVFGGEYGPYVIPSLTTGDSRRSTLYYLLSTWNPYEVMLMRTTLEAPRLRISDHLVFVEQLAGTWQDWSWQTYVDWYQQDTVRSGAVAAQVAFEAPWAAFSLRSSAAITTANLSALDFWIHGGEAGVRLNVAVQESDDGDLGPSAPVEAAAGVWTHVRIPLADLGSPARIARINWQDATGAIQPPFLIDDVTLAGAEEEAGSTLYLPSVRR